MMKGVRTTIIGGIVFLIPLIFILMILSYAFGLAWKVAKPLSELMPMAGFAGLALVNILAAVIVAGFCYLAGMAARSSIISGRVERLDGFLVRAFPSYHTTKKALADTIENSSFEDNWKVVLVGEKNDKRSLGFEVDRLANKDIVVFQPLAPNTKTGFIWTVPPDLVEVLDIDPRTLTKLLASHGIGISNEL